MASFIEMVKTGKPLVSDGAWGTFLHEKGLQPGECPEEWNVSHREDVLDIARSYIEAGADMIETNSFGGNPFKLENFNLKERTSELNEAAAAISRQAAGTDHFVLGSIGPTGKMLIMGDVTDNDLYEGFQIQAEALERGGADAIIVETMSALDEAVLAVKAAKDHTGLPVICTMTFEQTVDGGFKTMMGVSVADMVHEMQKLGTEVIGANCGNGMSHMVDVVREIRTIDEKIPVLIHANAGMPVLQDGHTVFPETPSETSSHVLRLMEAGTQIVGGCCGTTPAHIRAIAEEVKRLI